LTDSGSIQEEAPSLGKTVLVMDDTTERPEGIAAGTMNWLELMKRIFIRHLNYSLKIKKRV
jgi:UDP-N-acetylglucosamine 2-epimerase